MSINYKEIAVFDDATDEVYVVKACYHSDALAVTPASFRRAMDLDGAREWGYMDNVSIVGHLDVTDDGDGELEGLFAKAYSLCH